MKKKTEINKMKDSEIVSLVTENRETLRGFRFGTGGKDVSAHRIAKKEIARALTELQVRRQGSGADNA